MYIVTVEHHCRKDMLEKAERRIDENGALMNRVDGFVFRHRLAAENDPLLVMTITAWKDIASYGTWLKVKPASAPGDVEALYERVKNMSYQVKQSH